MNKRKLIIYTFFILISLVINSDVSKAQRGFTWDRLVFGGNFGAGFSTNESIFAMSPSVGYRFTERLTIGAGGIYQYYGIRIPGFNFKFNNYGSRIFTTYQLTDFLIAHTEHESLNIEYIKYNSAGIPESTARRTINSLFVGGGYRQSIGRNSVVDLMLLYNLTETPYTRYTNPLVRVGFGFGL